MPLPGQPQVICDEGRTTKVCRFCKAQFTAKDFGHQNRKRRTPARARLKVSRLAAVQHGSGTEISPADDGRKKESCGPSRTVQSGLVAPPWRFATGLRSSPDRQPKPRAGGPRPFPRKRPGSARTACLPFRRLRKETLETVRHKWRNPAKGRKSPIGNVCHPI